ncbi:MAG TPA: hypothetical protein VIW24_31425 [Aldersonia sp.]
MTSMYGADVAELRTLASFLDQNAERLQVLSRVLGRRVESSRSWSGPDADRFRSDWPGNVASPLRSAAERLRDSAQALHRNAHEQENASGAEGAAASPGSVAANGSTPLPDPRDLTLNGVNLWDLAKLAAGNVGPLERIVDVVGIGEALGDFGYAVLQNDPSATLDNGADLIATTLKFAAPPFSPIHLAGSALDIWKFVIQEGAKSDFSPEGITTVGNYIAQDPAGAAQGALDGLRANAVSIVSAVL